MELIIQVKSKEEMHLDLVIEIRERSAEEVNEALLKLVQQLAGSRPVQTAEDRFRSIQADPQRGLMVGNGFVASGKGGA